MPLCIEYNLAKYRFIIQQQRSTCRWFCVLITNVYFVKRRTLNDAR